jgi:hypothetical protein
MKQNIKIMMFIVAYVLVALNGNSQPVKKIYYGWSLSDVSKLEIENKFGTIYFHETTTDSVTIEATFDIDNLSKNNAEYLANQVIFDIKKSGQIVFSKTSFTDNFKTSQDFEIIFTIRIPKNLELKINNSYGDVYLPDITKNATINIEYGNLQAGNINTGSDYTNISVKYGKISFNNAQKLEAQIHYGELTCTKIDDAIIESQYSIVKIDTTNKITISSNFDDINIRQTNNLEITSNYSRFAIEKIVESLQIKMKHGNFIANAVSESFKDIKIENIYGDMYLQMPAGISYFIDSETYYSDLKFPNGIIINQNITKDFIRAKTKIGNDETQSRVQIKSRFGSVHLTK